MDKIKVVHIISNMNDGGAQRIVLNYINDFVNNQDIEVQLLVLEEKNSSYYNKELDNVNIKVDYLNCFEKKYNNRYIQFIYKYVICNIRIKKYLTINKPDIVHIHLCGALLFSSSSITRLNGIILKKIQHAFKKENFIPICVTKEQALVAKEHYKFNKYEVVHNGINLENIKKDIVDKNTARKIFGFEAKDYIVCGVGRLEKIKKYDLLIKAFSIMTKIKDNVKLIIAGEGTEETNLKNLVNELNLNNKVFFLGNIQNTTELYCACDVLAVTSESESSSLVLLEAQACGLRCVISNGVPSESIITNKVKKMKEDTKLDDWANALLDTNYIGNKNYDFDDYEVHKMSKKMKDIYIKYWEEYKQNAK